MRLHITSVAPPHIVDEVVNTLVVAARRLGHEVTSEPFSVRDDSVNIVCFALALDPATLKSPRRIVVNFEPLVAGAQAHSESYLDLLRSNYVWEYSTTNLALYPQLGVQAGFHLPLGFEEEADITVDLADRLPESAMDIDVLFFGGLNERRDRVIQQMRQRGLNVVTNGSTLWAPEYRDAMIRRAKVVLNMHRFDNFRVAEMPRLSMLLRRRKAVVCELYPDSEIQPELRDVVAGAPLERLVDVADLLVCSPALRNELETKGLEALKKRRQADVMQSALDHYLAWSESKAASRAQEA